MYELILIPVLVGLITQAIKLIIDGIPNNFSWQHIINDYGGMPSAHTAFVAALSTVVGLSQGFASAAFAICLALTIIVVRDAMGFRREIGKNAELTNMLAQQIFKNNSAKNKIEYLRERVGHTAMEIAVGLILGVVLTFLFYWFMVIT